MSLSYIITLVPKRLNIEINLNNLSLTNYKSVARNIIETQLDLDKKRKKTGN
jgi:hypothetical protein